MQPNLDTRASMMDKLVLVKPCVLLLQDAHLIIFVVVALMVAQLIHMATITAMTSTTILIVVGVTVIHVGPAQMDFVVMKILASYLAFLGLAIYRSITRNKRATAVVAVGTQTVISREYLLLGVPMGNIAEKMATASHGFAPLDITLEMVATASVGAGIQIAMPVKVMFTVVAQKKFVTYLASAHTGLAIEVIIANLTAVIASAVATILIAIMQIKLFMDVLLANIAILMVLATQCTTTPMLQL